MFQDYIQNKSAYYQFENGEKTYCVGLISDLVQAWGVDIKKVINEQDAENKIDNILKQYIDKIINSDKGEQYDVSQYIKSNYRDCFEKKIDAVIPEINNFATQKETLWECVCNWFNVINAKEENENLENEEIELIPGNLIKIVKEDVIGNSERISVNYKNVLDKLNPGDTILFDDGLMNVKVKSREEDGVTCEIIHGGILSSRKGVATPGVSLDIPFLSEQDKKDIKFACENDGHIQNEGVLLKKTDDGRTIAVCAPMFDNETAFFLDNTIGDLQETLENNKSDNFCKEVLDQYMDKYDEARRTKQPLSTRGILGYDLVRSTLKEKKNNLIHINMNEELPEGMGEPKTDEEKMKTAEGNFERMLAEILDGDAYRNNHEHSVGLHNVNSRLKLFYGREYGLNIESQGKPGKGTRVTVRVPIGTKSFALQ